MNPIQETTRTFQTYTNELLLYIRDFYPEMIPLFSDNSFGQILLEANAAVGMNISTQITRSLQESRLDESLERRSLYAIAKNNSVRIPNVSPALTFIDFSFNVPVQGDTFASEYLPIVKSGTQVVGGGQIFEVIEDIDFSEDFSIGGMPNRKIVPILNGNNEVVRYEITKREILLSGQIEIFRRSINTSEDFLEIVLPSTNVISVDQVIIKNGTALSEPDTEDFFDEDLRWYEVDSLSQKKVFIKDGFESTDGLYKGKWLATDKKFTTEFTPNGFCKIIFGNGKGVLNDFSNILSNDYQTQFFKGIYENNSLGKRVPSNSSIYIKYRVGGGETSNVNANTLTNVGFTNISINGSNQTLNNDILKTLTVNNPIPAVGGKGLLTNQEIEKFISFNKEKRSSGILTSDYLKLIDGMDGKFGKPYKSNISLNNNKIEVYIIGLDGNGKLTKPNGNLLANNVKDYLKNYKAFNDYIEVLDGKIINLGLEIEIIVPNEVNDGNIVSKVYEKVQTFINNYNFRMGGEFNIAELGGMLQNLKTVLAVNYIKTFNLVDSDDIKYSSDVSKRMTLTTFSKNGTVTKYQYQNNPQLIISDGDEIFEIKNITNDVKINLKKTIF